MAESPAPRQARFTTPAVRRRLRSARTAIRTRVHSDPASRTTHPRFLQFFYLQKIQFDRRRSSEDRHHHLERVAIEIHFVHGSVETRERALVDAYLIALL